MYNIYIYIYIYIYIFYVIHIHNVVIELYTSCDQVLELLQNHLGNNQEGKLFS